MKNIHNFWIDIAAFAIYLVVANPAITGLAIHEWISIGILVVFIVHMAVHYDWVIATCKNAFKNPSFATTGNFIIDILILLVFCLDTISGVLLSRYILPDLGLYADGYFIWKPIHALSSKVLLALIIVHIVTHWRWFTKLFKKKGSDGRVETTPANEDTVE